MSLHVAILLAFLSCCRASVLPSTVAAPRGPITCVAEDPEFERLVGGGLGNQGEVISEHEQALFHEAGVWLPETGEWLFTSNRLDDNGPRIKVHVLHAKSRTLTECDEVQAAGGHGQRRHLRRRGRRAALQPRDGRGGRRDLPRLADALLGGAAGGGEVQLAE